MEKINNKPSEVNVRRTFIRKIFGAITAAVLLPKLSGLFASAKKWTSLTSYGAKNYLSSYDDAYIGEICIGGYNFAPYKWAFCHGQIIAISTNTALFSILGTTYGGNGTTTFALPDLQGRFPMGAGHGSGLSDRVLGESGGQEYVYLNTTEMPAHIHYIPCNKNTGNSPVPANRYFALDPLGTAHYGALQGAAAVIGNSGGSGAHNNMHPYLVLNFCICLNGLFPPRS